MNNVYLFIPALGPSVIQLLWGLLGLYVPFVYDFLRVSSTDAGGIPAWGCLLVKIVSKFWVHNQLKQILENVKINIQ